MEFYLKDIKDTITDLDKSIELELTNFCNARCSICPREEFTRPKGNMSLSTLKNLALHCEKYQINKISMGGLGEPLLHPDFARCVEILSSIKDADLSLTTNGALFREPFHQMIVDAPFSQISVSYHNFHSEAYQKFMGIKQEDCVGNIKKFIKMHPDHSHKISIAIVLNKNNENEIVDICRFWRIHGINRFIVLVAHNRSGLLNNQEMIDEAFYLKHNIAIAEEDKAVCRKSSFVLKFIDWQGKVHICCNDLKGKAVMGDINTEDFPVIENRREEIWESVKNTLCLKCNMPSTLMATKYIGFLKN